MCQLAATEAQQLKQIVSHLCTPVEDETFHRRCQQVVGDVGQVDIGEAVMIHQPFKQQLLVYWCQTTSDTCYVAGQIQRQAVKTQIFQLLHCLYMTPQLNYYVLQILLSENSYDK